MSRLVMKFGGTSVGDVERIGRVARIVAASAAAEAGLPWWCRPWPGKPTSS